MCDVAPRPDGAEERDQGHAAAAGGGLGGVTSGLGVPRATPNESYQRTDPFRLAERGFDPGVGTLLLQGVAFK